MKSKGRGRKNVFILLKLFGEFWEVKKKEKDFGKDVCVNFRKKVHNHGLADNKTLLALV